MTHMSTRPVYVEVKIIIVFCWLHYRNRVFPAAGEITSRDTFLVLLAVVTQQGRLWYCHMFISSVDEFFPHILGSDLDKSMGNSGGQAFAISLLCKKIETSFRK